MSIEVRVPALLEVVARGSWNRGLGAPRSERVAARTTEGETGGEHGATEQEGTPRRHGGRRCILGNEEHRFQTHGGSRMWGRQGEVGRRRPDEYGKVVVYARGTSPVKGGQQRGTQQFGI